MKETQLGEGKFRTAAFSDSFHSQAEWLLATAFDEVPPLRLLICLYESESCTDLRSADGCVHPRRVECAGLIGTQRRGRLHRLVGSDPLLFSLATMDRYRYARGSANRV